MNILSPSRFPNPSKTDKSGVVAVGGDLQVETLVDAYAHGIFPWPHKGYPLLWFSPVERGVLMFSELHIPRSFLKWMKKTSFNITFNQSFSAVIKNCALVPRPGETETWITPEMIQAYTLLQKKGIAHSVECWHGDRLVGGLYGVFVAGVFSAESMFYHESGASKFCLLALVHRLNGLGIDWIDTQMVSPVVATFGGRYVVREVFLNKVKETQQTHSQAVF